MKTLATLLLLLLMAGPGFACPQQTAEAALDDAGEAPEASSATTPEADPEQGDASDEKTDAGDDVMKKFTRHRPGACPEGPPCNVEE